MEIEVTKITDASLLRKANSFTTGHESKMSLATAYRMGHSPIRTQMFWIECKDIPLCVASHLVRHAVGVTWFQRSKRPDRGGADFSEITSTLAQQLDTYIEHAPFGHLVLQDVEEVAAQIRTLPTKFDRHAPTDIAFICNAETLMNIAHARLCHKASAETRKVVQAICSQIKETDPALFPHLVPKCIYRGGICSEYKSCGLATSNIGIKMIEQYKLL